MGLKFQHRGYNQETMGDIYIYTYMYVYVWKLYGYIWLYPPYGFKKMKDTPKVPDFHVRHDPQPLDVFSTPEPFPFRQTHFLFVVTSHLVIYTINHIEFSHSEGNWTLSGALLLYHPRRRSLPGSFSVQWARTLTVPSETFRPSSSGSVSPSGHADLKEIRSGPLVDPQKSQQKWGSCGWNEVKWWFNEVDI